MESRSLADQVVIITGATSGIGEAAARELAKAGARLVVTGRNQDRLNQLVAELGDDRVLGVPMDVRSPTDASRVARSALDRFGRIDTLVANAGIGAYGGILDHSDDLIASMVDTNITGTIWPIRAVLPTMLESGEGGDIVIVASVAGLRGGGNEAVYASTKGAQVNLAGALDRELTPKGVRVTAVCPAGTRTQFAMGHGRRPGMPGLAEMMDPADIGGAIRIVLEQPRRLRTSLWAMWSMAEVG